MKELKIDPELRDLLPPLADDEYKQLEKNIVDNGFDRNFPIMEWHGFIVDGHTRNSYFVMVSYPSTWTELELLLIVCSPSIWTETAFNFRFNFRM